MHDLANVFAGIRGIIDLSRADRPLTARDRERLEAVLAEGMTTLERTRNLALGVLPDAALIPGLVWRDQLLEQLEPMGVLFRCRFRVTLEGEAACDYWPGDLLQGYVRAITRQVLPHMLDGFLDLHCAWDAREWRLRWSGTGQIPENLLPVSAAAAQDIGSRWAARSGDALGVTLTWTDGTLLAQIPRP